MQRSVRLLVPRALALAWTALGSVPGQVPCGPIHYGAGAAGSGGIVPRITAVGGLPRLGNGGFGLQVDSLDGGALVGHLLGVTPSATPVLGISVLVDPIAVTTAFASGSGAGAGRAVFPLPVPNVPVLLGETVRAQGIARDAGASLGLSATDGIQLRLVTDHLLGASAAYQGSQASDAFSAIHHLGSGRLIAGKRSSQAANRFLLSEDHGHTWRVVGCPASTGAHTYFFGQNDDTILCGTGDTGNACLMHSRDGGRTWAVALTSSQLRSLTGSADVRAVFGPVFLGAGRWLVNLKCLDTRVKVIASSDDGASWYVPGAQPGRGPTAWARRMIRTRDGVLLWPACLTDEMFLSHDHGASWTAARVPGASLFQPLCDTTGGAYVCGDASALPNATLGLHRSLDRGRTWTTVTTVNLGRTTPTYWRDVLAFDGTLLASACCAEGTSHERFMQLFRSVDGGATWCSYGNPYQGPHGGMQAIYQMCLTDAGTVFAACQPDSTILRWPIEVPP